MERRAVLYGRVSKHNSARPTEGKSVDQQLAELTTIARRENVTIVGTFRDDGVSASRYGTGGKDREGWRDVTAALINVTANELWAWEISRATRDRPVWAALVNVCITAHAKITICGRVHDPEDPDDGFMLDLMAALAVRESGVTSKRILRDVAARAERGLPHGRLPYGYRREYDPVTRDLLSQVPDEKTAPIVREISRRCLAGEPLAVIAADLTSRGVPTPAGAAVWDPTQVKRVAISPTNAGIRTHKEESYPAVWEPIVSESDHRRLVALLTDRSRRTWTDGSIKHLLVGIAECGVCGAPCRRIKNRGTPSYSCSVRFCVSRVQRHLDDYVTRLVIARLSQPDAVDLLAPVDDADAAEAMERCRALRIRLDELYAEVSEGLSAKGLAKVERGLLNALADAERRSIPRSAPTVLVDMVTADDVAGVWQGLAVSQRREVVRVLMTPRIMPTGKGTRRFRPESVEIVWNGSV